MWHAGAASLPSNSPQHFISMNKEMVCRGPLALLRTEVLSGCGTSQGSDSHRDMILDFTDPYFIIHLKMTLATILWPASYWNMKNTFSVFKKCIINFIRNMTGSTPQASRSRERQTGEPGGSGCKTDHLHICLYLWICYLNFGVLMFHFCFISNKNVWLWAFSLNTFDFWKKIHLILW